MGKDARRQPIPANLEAAHTALTEARSAHASATAKHIEAEQAVASATAQLTEVDADLDAFGDVDRLIRSEQAERIGQGLLYQLSDALRTKRDAARLAAGEAQWKTAAEDEDDEIYERIEDEEQG